MLEAAATRGFTVDDISAETLGRGKAGSGDWAGEPRVEVLLHLHSRVSVNDLAAVLSEVEFVESVHGSDANAVDDD